MSIVQVNVNQTSAPVPSLLQKKGAVISQGGTNKAAGTITPITQLSDLTPIQPAPLALTSLAWAAGVVTATTTAPHNIPNGQVVPLTIAGAAPAGYNGTFQCTSTGASTFTYPLAANPGAETAPGTYTPAAVAEVLAAFTTIFAQGSQQAVWVLELGMVDTAHGVTALGAYITANTAKGAGPFYAYLPPREWDAEPTFLPFAATFSNVNSKTYFFATTKIATFANIPATTKSINAMVEAPNLPAIEFSHAADFRQLLNFTPSATNKVTPFDNTELFGVTAFPTVGNATIIAQLLAASINMVATGSEGGLTELILNNGTTMDGRDQSYWYSVDWVEINVQRDVAAAVIDGSNNPQNPLFYNQDGINRLQRVIASTMGRGVSFGLVLGAPVQVQMNPQDFVTAVENGQFAGVTAINAQSFLNYSLANPNDFALGLYSGFQIAYTPSRGFKTIIININVTDFVAA
jgi:hypothetical protein